MDPWGSADDAVTKSFSAIGAHAAAAVGVLGDVAVVWDDYDNVGIKLTGGVGMG